jgi:hypothetical protein
MSVIINKTIGPTNAEFRRDDHNMQKKSYKIISPVSVYKHGDGVKSLHYADIVGGNLVKSKISHI